MEELEENNQVTFNKYDEKYMRMAYIWSENSYCKRKQVGSIIVKDNKIISDGYNGTPTGLENNCEDENENGELVTKWHVLHAESNALNKLEVSAEGSTLYVTISPCKECCKNIIQKKVSRVVFNEFYRDSEGLDLLREVGIEVVQLNLDKNQLEDYKEVVINNDMSIDIPILNTEDYQPLEDDGMPIVNEDFNEPLEIENDIFIDENGVETIVPIYT